MSRNLLFYAQLLTVFPSCDCFSCTLSAVGIIPAQPCTSFMEIQSLNTVSLPCTGQIMVFILPGLFQNVPVNNSSHTFFEAIPALGITNGMGIPNVAKNSFFVTFQGWAHGCNTNFAWSLQHYFQMLDLLWAHISMFSLWFLNLPQLLILLGWACLLPRQLEWEVCC